MTEKKDVVSEEREDSRKMINAMRHEVYRLYQYDWLMVRGYTIGDIVRHAGEAVHELINEGEQHETEDIIKRFEGDGFTYGGLYDEYEQFIRYSYEYSNFTSYYNRDYIKKLIERSPYDGDCYGGHSLLYWYEKDMAYSDRYNRPVDM